jgi:hypothetical protein
MDHAEAMQMRAVERYMLADLSVSEVEDFERHFFDCPQCSEELRTLSILRENARAVFVEQHTSPSISSVPVSSQPVTPPKSGRTGWRFWSPMLAPALALLIAAVYVGYFAGERRVGEPQSVNAYPLYAASRGAETVIAPPAGAQFYTLYMDRTWDRDFTSYRAVVRDDGQAGSERFSMTLAAPEPGRAIQVLFPTRALAAGHYVMTILGKDNSGQESKAADYSFTLRFQ